MRVIILAFLVYVAYRLLKGLSRSKLWVDPRYGRLTRTPVRVVPPTPPAPRSNPPETAPTS